MDEDIWELVRYCSKGVAPPWPALKEAYCRDRIVRVIDLHDSIDTAKDLGLIKEVDHLRYCITIKGYKLAEKLWGPGEEACKKEEKKASLWDLLG